MASHGICSPHQKVMLKELVKVTSKGPVIHRPLYLPFAFQPLSSAHPSSGSPTGPIGSPSRRRLRQPHRLSSQLPLPFSGC